MDEAKELFDQVHDDFNSAIKSDENEDKQFFHFAQMLDRISDTHENKMGLLVCYKKLKVDYEYEKNTVPKYDFNLVLNILVSIVCGLIVADMTKGGVNLNNTIFASVVGVLLLACPIVGTKFSIDVFGSRKNIKNTKFLYFFEKYLIDKRIL